MSVRELIRLDPLQRGFTLVEFEEEADPRSPLRCLRPITAALLAGYQLSPTDGGRAANMEHVFHVPRHPRNLPAMKRNQIRRTIAFRFRQAVLSTIAGEALRVEEFIAALASDARLRAAFSARADWDKSLAIMD